MAIRAQTNKWANGYSVQAVASPLLKFLPVVDWVKGQVESEPLGYVMPVSFELNINDDKYKDCAMWWFLLIVLSVWKNKKSLLFPQDVIWYQVIGLPGGTHWPLCICNMEVQGGHLIQAEQLLTNEDWSWWILVFFILSNSWFRGVLYKACHAVDRKVTPIVTNSVMDISFFLFCFPSIFILGIPNELLQNKSMFQALFLGEPRHRY